MSLRVKILYLIPQIVQGGAERQVLTLYRRLPERFEPALCVFELSATHYRELLPPGEPRADLGGDGVSLRAVRQFREVLRRERPALVHSFMDRANFVARVAAHLEGGPPVITSVRGPLMQLRYLSLERTLSTWCARITTNSVGIRRELTRYGRVPADRIEVIPNLVDLAAFRPATDDERRAARERLSLPQDAPVILMAGMVGLAKNHNGLAIALWHARSAGWLPAGTRVLFAGRRRDRLPAMLLPKTLRLLSLNGLCRFLGPVSDMPSLYAASDMLVLPSLYEGLSNVVLEAQASGLPAVVSRGANRDEIVEDGVTGFVVPTGNTRALAEAIGRAIALPTWRRAAMGTAGRERVLDRFDPERTLAQTLRLYDQVLGSTA